jgi:hypothetical protein
MIKKLLYSTIGSAILLLGLNSAMNAQTTCKWTVTPTVVQPTCAGQCNGSVSISLSGASGLVFTYQWSSGDSTANIFNLCEDEYILTITDDKGCSETFTYSIEDPDSLFANCSVVNNESYPGAADGELMASATGGTAPYSYEWQTNPPVMGANLTGLTAGTYFVIAYDANGCQASTFCMITAQKKDTCDGFRTQTQGGWGQCHQNGNNPGTYLFANFAGAFPNGLTIGCTNTLELSSAQAVCEFLPSGKKPQALPSGTITDPAKSYRNVLAGQVAALALNVGFDAYDEGFSVADDDLGDQIINSGPFSGMTVYDLLDEANDFLGGCGSGNYSASQLNSAVSSVNENYVDGNQDKGFLDCPGSKKRGDNAQPAAPEGFRVNIYPNPTSSDTNLELSTENDNDVNVAVYSYAGQKVLDVYNGPLHAGEMKNIRIETTSFNSGMYFIRVTSETETRNYKLFIQ